MCPEYNLLVFDFYAHPQWKQAHVRQPVHKIYLFRIREGFSSQRSVSSLSEIDQAGYFFCNNTEAFWNRLIVRKDCLENELTVFLDVQL